MESKFIEFQGKPLHYVDHGIGHIPVLLLHGFLESATIWDFMQTPLLAKNTRLIIPDLPGFGKSAALSQLHSMTNMAEAVYQILQYESLDEIIVVGHSMGGYVALALASTYPGLVKKLALLHSHPAADTAETTKARENSIKAIQSDKKAFIHAFIPALFWEENKKKFQPEINHLISEALLLDEQNISAAMDGMKTRTDHTGFWINSPISKLHILGNYDSRIPVKKWAEANSKQKTIETLILQNSAHMGFIEERKKVADTLTAFFMSNTA